MRSNDFSLCVGLKNVLLGTKLLLLSIISTKTERELFVSVKRMLDKLPYPKYTVLMPEVEL